MNKARRLVQTVGLCVKMGVEPYTLFTGDNLPIMRGMDDESVDLIYLDPPFNKKKIFEAPIGSGAEGAKFEDTWKMSDVKSEEIAEVETENKPLADLINLTGNIGGNSHKAYLIFMALRLIQMKRILKNTGSIYLHCDPTMSHWLKLLMDTILGRGNFTNEIIWAYKGPSNVRKHFPRKHDCILFFKKSGDAIFNIDAVRIPYSQSFLERRKHSEGETGITKGYAESRSQDRVKEEFGKGKVVEDCWTDIPSGGQISKTERTGYPTQKPLALLNRIIEASSNEGDIVFDPFCGCVTTPIAAMRIARRWIGIDLSEKAVDLIHMRMKREGLFGDFIHRTDIPVRSDRVKRSPNVKDVKYGEQNGNCACCLNHFYKQNLTVDHDIPKSKGGTDDDSNLVLFCGLCNSIKGADRTLSEAKARYKQLYPNEYKGR